MILRYVMMKYNIQRWIRVLNAHSAYLYSVEKKNTYRKKILRKNMIHTQLSAARKSVFKIYLKIVKNCFLCTAWTMMFYHTLVCDPWRTKLNFITRKQCFIKVIICFACHKRLLSQCANNALIIWKGWVSIVD